MGVREGVEKGTEIAPDALHSGRRVAFDIALAIFGSHPSGAKTYSLTAGTDEGF